MTRQATIGVEPGTEPVVPSSAHGFHGSEPGKSILEKRDLVFGQSMQRPSQPLDAGAHARVHGCLGCLANCARAASHRRKEAPDQLFTNCVWSVAHGPFLPSLFTTERLYRHFANCGDSRPGADRLSQRERSARSRWPWCHESTDPDRDFAPAALPKSTNAVHPDSSEGSKWAGLDRRRHRKELP